MSGLSTRNLVYMRSFATAWPDRSIVQQVVARIPWGHNVVLLDKLKGPELRLWYAKRVEEGLIDHIQRFLLELGAGFAFVGRQVRLTVGDREYALDLLFYHLKQRCFVVIELKVVPFEPAFTGQLNFYLSAIDEQMRHPTDNPTIGLLLVRDAQKDQVVVEYALRGLSSPIGVASWEAELVRQLPTDLQGSLPSVEQLELELAGEE